MDCKQTEPYRQIFCGTDHKRDHAIGVPVRAHKANAGMMCSCVKMICHSLLTLVSSLYLTYIYSVITNEYK